MKVSDAHEDYNHICLVRANYSQRLICTEFRTSLLFSMGKSPGIAVTKHQEKVSRQSTLAFNMK